MAPAPSLERACNCVATLFQSTFDPIRWHALQDAIDKENDRLVKNGTLIYADSYDLATSIVVKEPDGAVGVCSGYSAGLNDDLVDIGRTFPPREHVETRYPGKRVFSYLDLADAYL